MTKSHLRSLIKECVLDVLKEQASSVPPPPSRFPDMYDTVEPLPLADGEYEALRYGYALEINGKTYKTKSGVRCMRDQCGGPVKVKVVSGVAREIR